MFHGPGKMKVLYDHQIFTQQEYGGVSRYFYELMENYSSGSTVEPKLPLMFSNNHYLSAFTFRTHKHFLKGFDFRGKMRILMLLNKRASVKALRRKDFDVFHPTYYDPYFLKYCSSPFVLTVYDMIHERFPEYFPARDNTSVRKRLLCSKADRIIAISQNTKKDLMEFFSIPESKISVVYLGNSLMPDAAAHINLPDKYILFVGDRRGYKSFLFFIESIREILAKNKELHVVCAGGGGWKREESVRFAQWGIEKQLIHISIKDSTLAYAYKNALFFVYPSLYEGFGIPVLEAFSCRCPVLLSNASSFPEVAGGAALYFEPGDSEDLRKSASRLLGDSELRNCLADRGENRLKFFSWDKCASQTAQVYMRL